jgi:hypothetical protein
MRIVCAILVPLLSLSFLARAGVVDRIAVVVGTHTITQSEVNEEARVTQFQNQEPLNLSPEERRAAAERLVDQLLLRNEMQLEHHQAPSATDGARLLEEFRRENYPSYARFEPTLRKYGITRQQLERHLLWQADLVRFVEFRFRGPGPPSQAQSGSGERAGSPAAEVSAEAQLDAWLKDARSQTRIEFKKDAFQ